MDARLVGFLYCFAELFFHPLGDDRFGNEHEYNIGHKDHAKEYTVTMMERTINANGESKEKRHTEQKENNK